MAEQASCRPPAAPQSTKLRLGGVWNPKRKLSQISMQSSFDSVDERLAHPTGHPRERKWSVVGGRRRLAAAMSSYSNKWRQFGLVPRKTSTGSSSSVQSGSGLDTPTSEPASPPPLALATSRPEAGRMHHTAALRGQLRHGLQMLARVGRRQVAARAKSAGVAELADAPDLSESQRLAPLQVDQRPQRQQLHQTLSLDGGAGQFMKQLSKGRALGGADEEDDEFEACYDSGFLCQTATTMSDFLELDNRDELSYELELASEESLVGQGLGSYSARELKKLLAQHKDHIAQSHGLSPRYDDEPTIQCQMFEGR